LVIRNTVRSAVATLRALSDRVDPQLLLTIGGIPAPHHSRFAGSDRKLLDKVLLERLGKQPERSKRRPVIAVTTQTAEQSLDLDADLLITDLCPIDVLLQRIGRLHRHQAERPEGFEGARAVVVSPVDSLASAGKNQGLGSVYEDVTILACTLELVEHASSGEPWVLPRDNRDLGDRSATPGESDLGTHFQRRAA